jgi:16S rRNA (guanine(966)-N(2))-methyltransferase RsmD
MRIISGEYRGRVLKSPPDLKTRPTSDRLRETLFNILAPRIKNSRFMDLCAGSGAVGIEALSRGAIYVSFVDRSRKMCVLTESNLALCRVPKERFEIIVSDAAASLRQIKSHEEATWDLVFFDPPYTNDYMPVLNLFSQRETSLLNKDGLLIVEHYRKNLLPDRLNELRRWRIVKQGDSCLSFYEYDLPE